MPYTEGQVTQFPECEASIDATADEGGIGFIRSSQSVGYGHVDGAERMPDPNTEWATTPSHPENVTATKNTPPSTTGQKGPNFNHTY